MTPPCALATLCILLSTSWTSPCVSAAAATATGTRSSLRDGRALRVAQTVHALPALWEDATPFKLLLAKKDLCLSDHGDPHEGGFGLAACDSASTFVYNKATSQIVSTEDPLLCLDDGRELATARQFLQLRPCAADGTHQTFGFSSASGWVFSLVSHDCVDVGSTDADDPSVAVAHLATCNEGNDAQTFSLIPGKLAADVPVADNTGGVLDVVGEEPLEPEGPVFGVAAEDDDDTIIHLGGGPSGDDSTVDLTVTVSIGAPGGESSAQVVMPLVVTLGNPTTIAAH